MGSPQLSEIACRCSIWSCTYGSMVNEIFKSTVGRCHSRPINYHPEIHVMAPVCSFQTLFHPLKRFLSLLSVAAKLHRMMRLSCEISNDFLVRKGQEIRQIATVNEKVKCGRCALFPRLIAFQWGCGAGYTRQRTLFCCQHDPADVKSSPGCCYGFLSEEKLCMCMPSFVSYSGCFLKIHLQSLIIFFFLILKSMELYGF